MDGNQFRREVEMLKGRKINVLLAALVAAFAVFVLGYQGGKHLAGKENVTNSLTPEASVIAVKDEPFHRVDVAPAFGDGPSLASRSDREAAHDADAVRKDQDEARTTDDALADEAAAH